MGKLNVNTCTTRDGAFATPDDDRAPRHLWGSAPTIEQTELGPVGWWLCGRCPARVLHDPETEDGFPPEPIVVYQPSCFDLAPYGAPCAGPGRCEWCSCGCPRRASGDVVHLDGCVDQNVRIEEHLRELDEEAGFTGPLSLAPAASWQDLAREALADGRLSIYGAPSHQAPEPASIVHPPTDPAPPSDELARAIEHAEADIPTQRYPVVETGPSVFERIERLFGRPIIGEAR